MSDQIDLHPIVAELAHTLTSGPAGPTLPSPAVDAARAALRHAGDDAWEHLLAWTHRVVLHAGPAAAEVRSVVLQLLAEKLGGEEAAADRFARSTPAPAVRAALGQPAGVRAPLQPAAPDAKPVRAVRGIRATEPRGE